MCKGVDVRIYMLDFKYLIMKVLLALCKDRSFEQRRCHQTRLRWYLFSSDALTIDLYIQSLHWIHGVQKKFHLCHRAEPMAGCPAAPLSLKTWAVCSVRFLNLSSVASRKAETELKLNPPDQRQINSDKRHNNLNSSRGQVEGLKLHTWTQKRNRGWDAQRPG